MEVTMHTNKLKEKRESKRLKQRELAESAHVCQTTVSELERGVRTPWLKVAEKIAKVLGSTVEEVFPNDFTDE
jgi:DNA-binding XRE family transcriptional regulator